MTLRCSLDGCRGKRVGYAAWCREHTDQIVEGRIRLFRRPKETR